MADVDTANDEPAPCIHIRGAGSPRGVDVERLTRLLRLARQRRDLLAIATLETALRRLSPESELRALWGDR